eukprot:11439788-Alexandrium_andersonii.AAC.1
MAEVQDPILLGEGHAAEAGLEEGARRRREHGRTPEVRLSDVARRDLGVPELHGRVPGARPWLRIDHREQ